MKYRVLVEQDEDGVFVAEAPSLPGCVSQGATRAHAVAKLSGLPLLCVGGDFPQTDLTLAPLSE